MTAELKHLNSILVEALGLGISNVCSDKESGEYHGSSLRLGHLKVKYRKAKNTPKKTGQFVALWKRSISGNTEPFSVDDDFDLYIIESQNAENHGCFVFPKALLAERQILSVNGKEGKRGFRLYTQWDFPQSNQAKSSKSWQILNFIDYIDERSSSVGKLKLIVNQSILSSTSKQ